LKTVLESYPELQFDSYQDPTDDFVADLDLDPGLDHAFSSSMCVSKFYFFLISYVIDILPHLQSIPDIISSTRQLGLSRQKWFHIPVSPTWQNYCPAILS
jgi:hypothetical protein